MTKIKKKVHNYDIITYNNFKLYTEIINFAWSRHGNFLKKSYPAF